MLSENENIYMHACGPMIRNNLDSIQSAVDVRGSLITSAGYVVFLPMMFVTLAMH